MEIVWENSQGNPPPPQWETEVEWDILHSIAITTKTTSSFNTLARVCQANTGKALMLDIRTFNGERPTKTGVAYHLPELKWVMKTLVAQKEGSLNRGFKEIIISKTWNKTRFTVMKRKPAFLTKEITLYNEEVDLLVKKCKELIPLMEQKSIELNIPIDFIAGEKNIETYPGL